MRGRRPLINSAMALPEPAPWVQPSVPWPAFTQSRPTLVRPMYGMLVGVAGRRPVQKRGLPPSASVRVSHTPGHCPGGVCLAIGKSGETAGHLFVGDTLFAGSIGRTDLPGGNYDVLMASITRVLFPLGDDAIVHPGHGPDTTIGRERTTNPFVLEYLGGRGRS